MSDWISDPNLTREEKLARFEALGPEPTKQPARPVMVMPGAFTKTSTAHTFASASYEDIKRTRYSPVIQGSTTAQRSTPSLA